jgi:hypothetical protein
MPKYPFTLDSISNARQNKGSIGADSSAMYEYRRFVASDAKPGTHEVTRSRSDIRAMKARHGMRRTLRSRCAQALYTAGAFPAYKAARMNPVDALRHE